MSVRKFLLAMSAIVALVVVALVLGLQLGWSTLQPSVGLPVALV